MSTPMLSVDELVAALPGVRFIEPGSFRDRDPGFHPHNLAAGAMALPGSTDEVVRILKHCNAQGIPVVTQGGRTGLSGAAATSAGELLLDTSRMPEILELDTDSGTATVECGVTLESLEARARASGWSCGIDLAARGSATIGGMVATNAGGIEGDSQAPHRRDQARQALWLSISEIHGAVGEQDNAVLRTFGALF